MSELQDVHAIATLDDALRRRIYLLVRRRRRAVTREEVAADMGISRKLAAFHLDKLLDRGLLRAHYARPAGRSGPGAGRTAKMYETSDVELDVEIPERRYDLVGQVMVDAIGRHGADETARDAAIRIARENGLAVGEAVRRREDLGRPGPERTFTAALGVLEDHGYEPYRAEGGGVRLRNCPFHALARRAPDLVCEMNRSFVEGVVRGFGNANVDALLDRRPDECCVALRRRSTG
jgi:predicted ArsR family transcriptional regulator